MGELNKLFVGFSNEPERLKKIQDDKMFYISICGKKLDIRKYKTTIRYGEDRFYVKCGHRTVWLNADKLNEFNIKLTEYLNTLY